MAFRPPRVFWLVILIFSSIALLAEENRVQPDLSVVDSLQRILTDPGIQDTTRVDALLALAWQMKSSEPRQALDFAIQALEISVAGNLILRRALAMNHLGVIYWQMNDFPRALDYLTESNMLFVEKADRVGIARSSSNLGLVYSDQGHYDKALEFFLVAYNIYSDLGEQGGLSRSMNNIGTLYYHQGDYEMAEQFHMMSLSIKQTLFDQKGTAFSLNNLGLVMVGKGDYDRALGYFLEALAIRQTLPDIRETAITLTNLGHVYLLKREFNPAYRYLNLARELYDVLEDQGGLARIYSYIGRSMMLRGRLTQATAFYEQSLMLARRIGLPRLILENYWDLSEVMSEMGDYENAYLFQRRFIMLRDSLEDDDGRRKLMEMQLMYDRERKENEIQLLRKTNEIGQLNLEKQRLFRNYLLIFIAITLLFSFVVYNRFKTTRRSNKLLQSQRDEIADANNRLTELNKNLTEQKKQVEHLNHRLRNANEHLLESEKHLIASNATKDKFFSIISHDLRNPFASIVSFSRLLKRDAGKMTASEMEELVQELDQSVTKISTLLDNLLHWSRSQTGKIQYTPEYLLLNLLIDDSIQLFDATIREKEVRMLNQISGNLVVWADRNMTNTVLRNLISNALKYTPDKGRITISTTVNGGHVHVCIEDTGVGISQENQKKLFDLDQVYTTYGTRDEKGSGLGLLLCREFVEKQHGKLYFTSEAGKGSRFCFTLPVAEIPVHS